MTNEDELKEAKILKENELDKAIGGLGDYLTTRQCKICGNYTVWDNPAGGYYYCVTPGCDYRDDHS